MGLRGFNTFIENIGIPTNEDKLEITEKINDLLEKVKEAVDLPEYLIAELRKVGSL